MRLLLTDDKNAQTQIFAILKEITCVYDEDEINSPLGNE
ncbi:hypothetical protein HNQ74_000836 [Bartonella doshiae]|uniref:Uncharacterized protein n=2 Tax=Bartonella doshiae TaxID=33044 RepID=A0A380ZEW2_BARDO|nr:hypothetical protein MCS_00303 [Bartonella doshiae NCTC 12862 = ATCC 700133]MBB6159410.1 hypothetical protein [Bartonella doshiae]SUV44695.1 Uncharacterised protein [Bartonella doshiae]